MVGNQRVLLHLSYLPFWESTNTDPMFPKNPSSHNTRVLWWLLIITFELDLVQLCGIRYIYSVLFFCTLLSALRRRWKRAKNSLRTLELNYFQKQFELPLLKERKIMKLCRLPVIATQQETTPNQNRNSIKNSASWSVVIGQSVMFVWLEV